jgi:hypothetical protein
MEVGVSSSKPATSKLTGVMGTLGNNSDIPCNAAFLEYLRKFLILFLISSGNAVLDVKRSIGKITFFNMIRKEHIK